MLNNKNQIDKKVENCEFKTNSNSICYLCGKFLCINKKCDNYGNCKCSKTVDHIPPKQLFKNVLNIDERLKLHRQQLLTAVCCRDCNNKYSEYDDYFIQVISLQEGGISGKPMGEVNKQHIYNKIAKNKFKDIEINLPDYIYSGSIIISRCKVPTMTVNMNNIDLVNQKIIKGIYRNTFKENLFKKPQLLDVPYSLISNSIHNNILNTNNENITLVDFFKFIEYDKKKRLGLIKFFNEKNKKFIYKQVVKDLFSYLIIEVEDSKKLVILKYFTDVFYIYLI